MNIKEKVKKMVQAKSPKIDKTLLYRRELHFPREDKYFILLYNKAREKYDRSKIQQKSNPFHRGLLDADKCITYESLLITHNPYPTLEEQIVLFPFEVRENPTPNDLISAIRFSRETDYNLILNLKFSGASIPKHMHFQGHKTYFPVIDQAKAEFLLEKRGITIQRLSFPSYSVRLEGDETGIADIILEVAQINMPYNLFINQGNVNFVPRCKEIPSNLGTWQFGATEVSGLFFPRNFEQYRSLSLEELKRALEEATFNSKKELIEKLEANLFNIFRRKNTYDKK